MSAPGKRGREHRDNIERCGNCKHFVPDQYVGIARGSCCKCPCYEGDGHFSTTRSAIHTCDCPYRCAAVKQNDPDAKFTLDVNKVLLTMARREDA